MEWQTIQASLCFKQCNCQIIPKQLIYSLTCHYKILQNECVKVALYLGIEDDNDS